MNALEKYRDKWREVPAGDDVDGRVFSAGLLDLPDEEFLAIWNGMAERRASGAMAWFGPLYRDFFTGKRVLEIGSGAGVDGIPMAALGAHWTFADIVPTNLDTIRRVAALKGIDATFHLIVNSLPTVTPFSRPIVTPLGGQEWAYPRSAQEGPTRVAGAPHARGREARGRSLCTHVG